MQVEGIGEVLAWAEFWLLIYDGCGHETYLPRTGHRLYDPDVVEAEVRRYYADCVACARSRPGLN